MPYRQTSLFAYEDAKDSIGTKQREVLSAIFILERCTDKQIAKYLDWPINRVTPRRGELVSQGKVIEAGKMKNEEGRTVHIWQKA